MSAQINLYHPRFLKQRDLLTLGNLALAAAAVYAALALGAGLAWQDAATRNQAAIAAEVQLESVKEQVAAATQAAAVRKASPQLIAELENAESVLRRRDAIARFLESGAVGSTAGFAEYLRGFARQVPDGLWLTGFNIGSGGADVEIRGSMLNPSALPDYIGRLGAEKLFHGRSFASLTLIRAEPPPEVRLAGNGAAVSPAPTLAPRPIDFILMPKVVEAKEAKP